MIGKILGGRYEIIEQIGGGGMALVYKAKCQLLDRFVAIKILKDEFVNDEEFVRKFRRESQAAASLSHPNIVNIYDVGYESEEKNQIYYIVMEYIKGKTLKDIIKESGKLLMDTTLDYSLQIAEALQHAHKNHIVHRDIKPHNIMITDDNRVKVTDFGIARAATSSTVTARSDVLGSVHYFSPEQARGGYTDEKSDIYSLGIVMYEMVTGELPYQGESPITVALKHVQEDIVPPRKLDKDIPIWFENVILKAVEKRQADRYSNISELIKDIKRFKIKGKNIGIDDSQDFENHTKLIPVVNVKDENTMKNKNKNKRPNKDNNHRNIILIILLGFLTALIMYAGFHKIKDFFTSEEVYVISVVGLQEEEAKSEIEGLGLRFRVKARIKDSAPAGEVISQEIVDTKVKLNFPIEVTISDGDNLPSVPSITNKDLDYGRELLEDANLKMGNPTYEYNEEIPEGVIISQDPEAGTSVEPGTRINVVVSQGEEVKYVNMTKLVGLTIEKAENEIKRLDLVVGEVFKEPNDEFDKDIVFWQSFEVDTELETKTVVDLYISSGPSEETPEPNDNDGNVDVEEKQIIIKITPLADEEETTIIINRRQSGVTKEVYNQKHSSSETEINIPLSGIIGAEFDIYKNGIYQITIPVEE